MGIDKDENTSDGFDGSGGAGVAGIDKDKDACASIDVSIASIDEDKNLNNRSGDIAAGGVDGNIRNY